MSNEIVLGTVRGEYKDGSHLLVSKQGRRMSVHFTGDAPALGSDIIGNVSDVGGKLTMDIRPTLLEAILDGNAKIIPIYWKAISRHVHPFQAICCCLNQFLGNFKIFSAIFSN